MNKDLFNNKTDNITVNEAGGRAYNMSAKHALAQYICTSCMNGTYYTTASLQLDTVQELFKQVDDPTFVAKCALYGRKSSYMKDMPALAVAWLASHKVDGQVSSTAKRLVHAIWDEIIDSGNMLRNFVLMTRSGKLGRKCLGSFPKGMVKNWFDKTPAHQIFHQSIGSNPSIKDIIKMSHPSPNTPEKAALFAYFCGADIEEVNGHKMLRHYYCRDGQRHLVRENPFNNLPQVVKDFEAWKSDNNLPMPKVNFRFLDGAGSLSSEQWSEIAEKANWLTTLKNLNTYARHNVFENPEMVSKVADRLRDENEIRQARVFPYQIMMAFLATDRIGIPREINLALQDAMEVATQNVPNYGTQVYVCPDVSGSMLSPITGYMGSATSQVRCLDVASLFASSILRTNPHAEVLPFSHILNDVTLNPRDSVMTNSRILSNLPSGGTDCSIPLRTLNERNATGDLVVYISDYESWIDSQYYGRYQQVHPSMTEEWLCYKKRNPNAKLVCIDLIARTNAQVQEHKDVLQVGGFSDKVFDVISRFLKYGWSSNHWVQEIESIEIPK